MTITALPAAPSTADPANFNTKADAFIAALGTFVSETNAVAVAMNLNSTTDTSATSVLIGTGAKTLTVTAGKSFQPGMYLVIADTAAPSTNSMFGQVTSYSGTSLVMNITGIVGSGTKTAWTISQSASNAYATAAGTVTGSAVVTGAISSSSPTAGIGYANGAGAAPAAINIGGTATANSQSGKISINSTTYTAGVAVYFSISNNTVLAGDVVIVSPVGGNNPLVVTAWVLAGSIAVTVYPCSTTTGAVAYNFAVIKAVSA